MLPLTQIAFDRPGEGHRHAIGFGGNMIIMFKTEAEASPVGCCFGKQECSREKGKLRNLEFCFHREHKTTTL